jgi:uncharacterized protein with HEPN domain
MRPIDADLAYLWDMLKAAEAISRFVAGVHRETYFASEVLQAAVERKLEIIGEAAHKVSPAFQKEHPEVPWSKIIGQRNILAHNYGAIDHQRIWEVVTVHIPELVRQLAKILQSWSEE